MRSLRVQRIVTFGSLAALAGLGVVLWVARSGGGDQPLLERTPPPGAFTRACTSVPMGYSVRYPANWFADSGCHLFHHEPFDTKGVEVATAVQILPGAGAYAEAVRRAADPELDVVVSRDNVDVGGRRAVRLVARSSGETLYEEGVRLAAYVVDAPRGPLVLRSFGVPGVDFGLRVRVLDGIAATLRFLN